MPRFTLIAAAIALTGCGGSDTAPQSFDAFAGSYTLSTIDGKPLPAKNANGSTVTVGTLLFSANGAFQYTERTAEQSQAIETGDGACSVTSATTVNCRVSAIGALAFTGTLSGNSLTFATADGVKVYLK